MLNTTNIKETASRYFKSDFVPVLLLALAVAVFNYSIVSQLKQLPSPIYGGDFYNHLGTIYHLYYGGSLFTSGQLSGEIPWVPWLYHLYVLLFGAVTGTDPIQSNIFSSLPLIFISAALIYLIVSRYTKNVWLKLAAVFSVIRLFPVYKYTDFSFVIMSPLLIFAWLLFAEAKTPKRTAFLIFAITASNLTNTQLFFQQWIIFGVFFLNEILEKYKTDKNFFSSRSELLKITKPFLITGFASFVLSLPYWFWPFFIYKGATPNPLQIYGWADFSKLDIQLGYPLNVLKDLFFPGGDIAVQLLGLVYLAGFFIILKYRKKQENYPLFLLLVAALIGLFHHLITFNIKHNQFAPERMFQMIQIPLSAVAIVIAGSFLSEKLEKYAKFNFPFVPAVIILIVLFVANVGYSSISKNPFFEPAKQPLGAEFQQLREWIVANTAVNDVFLTNNEDAFMMNAISGRKSVTYRRTHAPVYADMNQRMLDTAVILHGKNNKTRVELLKKYNVRYVFWTFRWLQNEFQISNEGRVTGFFDPLMVPDKKEYREYLERNGVRYFQFYYYLDPAYVENYPKYDVLVVIPEDINFIRPWSSDLNQQLKQRKVIRFAGNNPDLPPFAIVYEVKYE